MSRRPLVIVHDREASRVPWEALRIGDSHPALERGLSRRYASENLSVARWREDRRHRRSHARTDGGQPDARPARRGTRRRGAAGGTASPPARRSTASRAARHRAAGCSARSGPAHNDILHFAGHGFFDAANPARSGLVCAGGDVLCGSDLERIGDLPSLVFFNACEAARVRRPGGARGRQRLLGLRKSSSLAEAFLDGGVANFVGTHWPVGDDAALAFSTHFYAAARRRAARRCDAGGATPRLRHRLDRLGGLRLLRQSAVPHRPATAARTERSSHNGRQPYRTARIAPAGDATKITLRARSATEESAQRDDRCRSGIRIKPQPAPVSQVPTSP